MASPLDGWDVGGDDGVPQPGTVEVHHQPVAACPCADGLDLLDGIDAAAAAIMSVLQAHQPGSDHVIVHRPNLVFEMRHIEDTVITDDCPACDSAENGRATCLINANVASCLAEQFIAGLGVDLDADLIRHGAGRHKQGSFLAEESGDAFLQQIDGRIFAENVVAHLGREHGGAHGSGRFRYGVAAEVDSGLRHEKPFLFMMSAR